LKQLIPILILGLCVSFSYGQNEAPEIPLKIIPEYHFNLSYTTVLEDDIQHAEIGLNKDLINVLDNKLRLGLGVRVGIQDNQNISFTSAHASIKKNEEHRDTLFHGRVQSAAFNFYFNGEYHLSKHISFGLNLDLLGISTGSKTDADYKPGVTSQNNLYYPIDEVESVSTAANAFSLGNSKGCLNAQVYAKVALSRKVAFRLGAAYLFQEFSTTEGYGAFNSYRYEYNTVGIFAGFTFNRFNEK
jgi:hypothetical protein